MFNGQIEKEEKFPNLPVVIVRGRKKEKAYKETKGRKKRKKERKRKVERKD